MKKKETVKSEYDLQAEKFLKDTGAKIESIYTGHRKHFEDDEQFRAVYSVTIIRDNQSMTFDFGQSINKSWKLVDTRYGISGKILPISHKYWNGVSVKKAMNTGQEILSGISMLILRKTKSTPKPYDILSCLTKYDPGTFDSFCSEFGYDTDSMRANKTYLAVQKEYSDLSRLFNESELESMQEIQ